ncbi:MAG: iron-desferrioxamine transport system substrate-binding protein [Thermoleophilaceae bacterium]|jgi:iron complex transport system substrate-binding protein|nr:iron-desferrioxamine transport system substrate-binding protein [Thermoleophilaceae bacterium]
MTLPDPEIARTTRRRFVVAGAGALTAVPLLLAACGGDDEAKPAARGKSRFAFTDDRGVEISLDGPVERIVAHEYAALALWDYGVRPVGIYGSVPFDEQPLFGQLDLSGVESVGDVWGEVNLEALAALRPDLVITTYWPSEKLLGGIKDDKLERKMTAIAPIAGIHAQVPATTTIEHFEELAGALGRDLRAKPVVAARKRYERAVQSFRTAVEAKPGLRVMAVYADPEALYVGKSQDYSDLREYQAWGLELVSGKGSDPYWEKMSWENADRYPADVILYDARATAPTLDKLADIPAWRRLPAVEAGQLSPWHMEEGVSYNLFAGHIEELAARIERSETVA